MPCNSALNVRAAADPDINGNMYYLIKNVRSGKYLTLQGNSTGNGTQIVQWTYTGENNQIWKFDYYGDSSVFGGLYHILPFLAQDMAIKMETAQNANGILAKLEPKENTVHQFFRIVNVGNGAKRFFTNGSNFTKVLEMNGASVYSNTSLIQYSPVDNGSDQWLIEPVNYNVNRGVDYSGYQIGRRLMTYPNFDHYENNYYKLIYQQTNYASQCLCAEGFHYKRDSNTSNWYCDKEDFYQPSTLSLIDIYTHWDISDSWYNGVKSKQYWISNAVSYNQYTYSQVKSDTGSILKPKKGGIVVITSISGNVESPFFAGYVTETASTAQQCIIRYQIGYPSGNDAYLVDVVDNAYEHITNMRVYIINFY